MSLERFQERTKAGFEALHAGRHEPAVRLLQQALEAALDLGDSELADEARVNLSQGRFGAGDLDGAEKGMRELLFRRAEGKIAFSAALAIARVCKARRDFERSRFYLDRALASAGEATPPLQLSAALNLRANLAMHGNDFGRAACDYAEALRLLEDSGTRGYALAVARDNLGYCYVLDEQMERGIPLLESALREAREHDVGRYIAEAAQDLCFAWLKLERPDVAEPHGRSALRGAEERAYLDIEKNALWLLGEALCRQGREDEAQALFTRLEAFYPGMNDLGRFLRTYDISAMVSLKEF